MCLILMVYKNHVTQNSLHVHVSHDDDTAKEQDARFITSMAVVYNRDRLEILGKPANRMHKNYALKAA